MARPYDCSAVITASLFSGSSWHVERTAELLMEGGQAQPNTVAFQFWPHGPPAWRGLPALPGNPDLEPAETVAVPQQVARLGLGQGGCAGICGGDFGTGSVDRTLPVKKTASAM